MHWDGDFMWIKGQQFVIVETIGDTQILRFARWYDRLAAWLRRRVQFRGFWSRVWDR